MSPRRTTRRGGARPDPRRAWRELADAVKARMLQPGLVSVPHLMDLRRAALGAAFPVGGEAPKAASNSLLEFVRTLPQAGEDQAGWHEKSLFAIADQVTALLDQADNARAAGARRMCGGDD